MILFMKKYLLFSIYIRFKMKEYKEKMWSVFLLNLEECVFYFVGG